MRHLTFRSTLYAATLCGALSCINGGDPEDGADATAATDAAGPPDAGAAGDAAGTPDGGQPPVDAGDGHSSLCADGLPREGDSCFTPQDGDSVGAIELLHQIYFSEMSSLSDHLGKGDASFWPFEALPPDTRPAWTTAEGERCVFEAGTNYPYYYPDFETFWPNGPGRGAGKMTFTVAGAPGPIELEVMDLDDGGPVEWGWSYYHDEVPPPLSDGTITYGDFFEPTYAPLGVGWEVAVAGGPHLAAQTFSGGEMPSTFTITAPGVEESDPAGVSLAQDLLISWDSPQPDAIMEVFLTVSMFGDFLLVSCEVQDDGEAAIPAAALENFYGAEPWLGVQLRRSLLHRVEVDQVGGGSAWMTLVGRHARIGRVPIEQ